MSFRSNLRDFAVAALAAAGLGLAMADEAPPKPISQAEKLLFMTDQLSNIKAPAVLKYDYRKSGSLEEPFQDSVTVHLAAQKGGLCCVSSGEFLTGTHTFDVPPQTDVDNAHGNQVILYFLEHDIAEMQRLTKGSRNHFRRQIRMTLVDEAIVTDAAYIYKGKSVHGKQVSFAPYANDQLRSKFEKFAKKQYVFMFSDAVPGGVYGIRTQMDADSAAEPPLIVEEIYLQGADPAPLKTTFNP